MAAEESLFRSFLRNTTWYLCFALLSSALGPFLFGYHLAELNAPQAVITCQQERIKDVASPRFSHCISMNTDQFAVVQSVYTLGGLMGALVAGPLCGKYGRLLTMRGMTAFAVIGPVIEAAAESITAIAFGRLISGVGAGAAIVVAPIYNSEISPPKLRGLFGSITQIMINLGILLAQVLGYFLSKGNVWRVILLVAAGVGVLQLLALMLLPESPKWLAEHHFGQRARKVLKMFRGAQADLEEELQDLKVDLHGGDAAEEESLLTPNHTLQSNTPASVGMLQAFADPFYRPALVAVVAVMVAQQLTGMNSIIMYSVSTLSALLPTTAALLTVFISVLNVIITTVCAPLSDYIGRKTCLLLSVAGMGLCSVLLSIGLGEGIKPLAAVASLLFVASFAIGLGPVPFGLASELVGPEAVGAAQSWALAANWVSCFIITQFFPILNEAMGGRGRAYIVFAVVSLVLGAFIAWRVPETKGKKNTDEVWGRKDTRTRLE